MSFESTTLGLLTGSAAVTALVSSSDIYFGTLPQNITSPAILCQITSVDSGPTTDAGGTGKSRLDNIEMQVTIYHRTYAQTNAVALAVRNALEADRGTRYFLKDQFGSFDDFPDLHGQILLFSSWYQTTI